MSQTPISSGESRRARRPRVAPAVLLAVAAAALAVVLLAGRQQESHADTREQVEIAYLYITNEGATAKAWYDGAPSPGVPVQEALDKFAKEGYRVARLTDNLRATADQVAFVILLQRVR